MRGALGVGGDGSAVRAVGVGLSAEGKREREGRGGGWKHVSYVSPA